MLNISIKISALFVFALLPVLLFTQDKDAQFAQSTINLIADTEIRSVTINQGTPYPVVDQKGGRIILDFDHLGYDMEDYVYTIVHCNSDWQPSELQDNEYIRGYTEDRILDISSSLNTVAPYTHYRVVLPNQNMGWVPSGNYLLKVFDDRDEHRLVMIRRFMVMENKWKVFSNTAQVASAKKVFSHQEVDFSINHEGTIIANPQLEIKAYVLQNMRWDRAIGPTAPRPFIAGPNQLNFDYQDSITFLAGKEFRFFDMRSFEYRGSGIQRIGREDDYYTVELKPEYDRFESHTYGLISDLNGGFSIENRTPGQDVRQADYAKVYFNLHRDTPFDDYDVYAVGEMTDWTLKEEFRMEYDEAAKAYYCAPLLKQGYYNYQFVVVDRKTGQPSTDEDIEGNWHETGNQYTILIYYRPRNGRFDRLMTVGGLDSRIRK